MSSYQKELEKYRDIDEDEILKTLSPEELEQLDCELQEMDPEVGTPAQEIWSSPQDYGRVIGAGWLRPGLPTGLGVCQGGQGKDT